MKLLFTFLIAVVFQLSVSFAEAQIRDVIEAKHDLTIASAVSDDGTLNVTLIGPQTGNGGALIVTERTSGQTFTFPINTPGLSRNPSDKSVETLDGGGSGGGGASPPSGNIGLVAVGCGASTCSFEVTNLDNGEVLGVLIVDYSGPQPKVTFHPSEPT